MARLAAVLLGGLVLLAGPIFAAEPARFTPADPEPDTTRYELQVIDESERGIR